MIQKVGKLKTKSVVIKCRLSYYVIKINMNILMNFPVKIVELWGHVKPDGTWSGLVRLAKDDKVDIIMCDMMHTFPRTQVHIQYYNMIYAYDIPKFTEEDRLPYVYP